MSYASITSSTTGATYIVSAGELHVPERGLWTATVDVETDLELAGQTVTLEMGEALSWLGTIIGGARYHSGGSYRLVGGSGGWRRRIARASYAGPVARLQTIVDDAARLVGETARVEADRAIGPYLRLEGPAAGVLQLASSWYVDADGVTVIGERPAAIVSPRVLDYRAHAGAVEVSEEEIVTLMPGAELSIESVGDLVIRSARHSMSGGSVLHAEPRA